MTNNQHMPDASGQAQSSGRSTPLSSAAAPGSAPAPSGSPVPAAPQGTGLAGLAHLSSFFAPVLVPLLIWLAVRDSLPYAARQAKQALCFHLVMAACGLVVSLVLVESFVSTLYATVSVALTSDTAPAPSPPAWLVALITFVFILGLTGQALSLYGAVQAFGGKDFRYPGLGWL